MFTYINGENSFYMKNCKLLYRQCIARHNPIWYISPYWTSDTQYHKIQNKVNKVNVVNVIACIQSTFEQVLHFKCSTSQQYKIPLKNRTLTALLYKQSHYPTNTNCWLRARSAMMIYTNWMVFSSLHCNKPYLACIPLVLMV